MERTTDLFLSKSDYLKGRKKTTAGIDSVLSVIDCMRVDLYENLQSITRNGRDLSRLNDFFKEKCHFNKRQDYDILIQT